MDNLLKLIFRAASVEPRYEQDLCLAAGKSVTCTSCQDVCPHRAIRVGRNVVIDPVDCSGCGLCVQACPTGALEPTVSFDRGTSLRCSKVRGTAQSVLCLGRLQATDLLKLLGSKDGVTLARGNCESCPVGGAAVVDAIERVRDDAVELASLHGRNVEVAIVEVDLLDEEKRSDPLSRRELLRGGWRTLQDRTGDLLAPLDSGDEEAVLPFELQRRYNVIAAARPTPEQPVPWSLPRIDEACILCPMCTNACPTDALERVFDSSGTGTLRLKPERCLSCDACVAACPVGAVTMAEWVSWEELSGGEREAYRRSAEREHPGSVAR